MTEKLEKLGTALSDALKEVQQIDVLLAGKRQTIAALDRQETEMSAALREKADEIAKLNVKIVLLRQRADGLVREAQTQANKILNDAKADAKKAKADWDREVAEKRAQLRQIVG